MGFNGKSLIIIGAILFIFQIANFFSIDAITPELERAQILAAIASLIIILIGFLFKQFEPLAGEKADLKGENNFFFKNNIPEEVVDELAWGSEAILTSTAAAAALAVAVSQHRVLVGLDAPPAPRALDAWQPEHEYLSG